MESAEAKQNKKETRGEVACQRKSPKEAAHEWWRSVEIGETAINRFENYFAL